MGKLGAITLLKNGETYEVSGEMSEIAKGWLMAFQEVEGSKMLTFQKMSDNTIRSYWVSEDADLKYMQETLDAQKNGGSFASWIVLWTAPTKESFVTEIAPTFDSLNFEPGRISGSV